LARSLGIVAIFAIVGPVAATAIVAGFILALGAPLLEILFDLIGLETLRSWLSIAIFLLVFFTLVAAFVPSAVAGIAFAVASVYFSQTSVWAALACAVAAVIGIVALGFVHVPSESSPLLLPGVKGLQQGAALVLVLSVPAAVAASLSWLFSRPLHRRL